MSFRTLRESNHLSQEKLAEVSGLSLRTIQRVEAGHRVSYASLRSLAIVFKKDADALERELYASPQLANEFIEVPRWIRVLNDGSWLGIPSLNRRQLYVAEACAVGLGLALLLASLFATSSFATAILRVGAGFALLCGYVQSIATRAIDAYKLLPSDAANELLRGGSTFRRSRGAPYVFALCMSGLFFAIVWLVIR